MTLTPAHKLLSVIVLETIISFRLVTWYICENHAWVDGIGLLLDIRETVVWTLNLCHRTYMYTKLSCLKFIPRLLVPAGCHQLARRCVQRYRLLDVAVGVWLPNCHDFSLAVWWQYSWSFPRSLTFVHSIWIKCLFALLCFCVCPGPRMNTSHCHVDNIISDGTIAMRLWRHNKQSVAGLSELRTKFYATRYWLVLHFKSIPNFWARD